MIEQTMEFMANAIRDNYNAEIEKVVQISTPSTMKTIPLKPFDDANLYFFGLPVDGTFAQPAIVFSEESTSIEAKYAGDAKGRRDDEHTIGIDLITPSDVDNERETRIKFRYAWALIALLRRYGWSDNAQTNQGQPFNLEVTAVDYTSRLETEADTMPAVRMTVTVTERTLAEYTSL